MCFFLQNPALATFVPSNRCGQSANNVGAANGICSEYTFPKIKQNKKGKKLHLHFKQRHCDPLPDQLPL